MSDELGNHNGSCDCDVSAAHFREWLRDKHGHVDVVNRAWRTDYWSQHYSNFPEIGTPAASTGFGNPGQLLDWRRFCSDALLEVYLAEKAVLREITPSIPVTTNFLVGAGSGEIGPGECDYARWAAEQDIVSNDHYLIDLRTGVDAPRCIWNSAPTFPEAYGWAAMVADGAFHHGQLAAVDRAKSPGEMEPNFLAHLGRGADAICFFQFRQSVIGAEKYHSARLPHAGVDSRWTPDDGATSAGCAS